MRKKILSILLITSFTQSTWAQCNQNHLSVLKTMKSSYEAEMQSALLKSLEQNGAKVEETVTVKSSAGTILVGAVVSFVGWKLLISTKKAAILRGASAAEKEAFFGSGGTQMYFNASSGRAYGSNVLRYLVGVIMLAGGGSSIIDAVTAISSADQSNIKSVQDKIDSLSNQIISCEK